MGVSEWEHQCQKDKAIEVDYIKSKHVVNLVTNQLIICSADDSHQEDDDTEDYDNNRNFHDEDGITSTCSASIKARPSPSFDFVEGIAFLSQD